MNCSVSRAISQLTRTCLFTLVPGSSHNIYLRSYLDCFLCSVDFVILTNFITIFNSNFDSACRSRVRQSQNTYWSRIQGSLMFHFQILTTYPQPLLLVNTTRSRSVTATPTSADILPAIWNWMKLFLTWLTSEDAPAGLACASNWLSVVNFDY